MDYIVTFEDGSDAYLSHHGKIGMHWGEWNEETRKRYMEHPELIGDYVKNLGLGVLYNAGNAMDDTVKNVARTMGPPVYEENPGSWTAKQYKSRMKDHLYRQLGLGKHSTDNAVIKTVRKWASYIAESYQNATESGFMSDPSDKGSAKFYKSLQKDTDELHGLRGKKAQRKAVKRRLKMYKNIASHF